MAVIYLKHDLHGAKVACSEQEAASDEANGWVRFDVAPVTVVEPEPAPVAPPPAPEPIVYVVTETNGMQPENAMAKRRPRRKAAAE